MSANARAGAALVVVMGGESFDAAKAVALLLAAHGVAVVVMGEHERSLGEIVGEIVYGGGRARHVVGDPRAAESMGAAIDKARIVFGEGRLCVVACSVGSGADGTADATGATAAERATAAAETMVAVGSALGSRGLAADADVLFLGPRDEEPEKLAQRVASIVAG